TASWTKASWTPSELAGGLSWSTPTASGVRLPDLALTRTRPAADATINCSRCARTWSRRTLSTFASTATTTSTPTGTARRS
ncbi:unnamed protein product, partial [Prorocentrum cordatum]